MRLILGTHLEALVSLPPHHGDPFDRLIIAQALVKDLTVVICDPHFPAYGVRVFWWTVPDAPILLDSDRPNGPGQDSPGQSEERTTPWVPSQFRPSPERARQRLSRTDSAEASGVRFPGLRSPLAPFDLGYLILAFQASPSAASGPTGRDRTAQGKALGSWMKRSER